MNNQYTQELKIRYDLTRERIYTSAQKAGRNPDSVRLVVVTKTHPLERIQAALEVGILDFGENYPEEAVEKIDSIGSVAGLNWHMIGHIQSRKADLVAKNFSLVHSLDSYKLAERLNRFANEKGRVLSVLLECNVSGEESKFGYPTFEKRQWDVLLFEIEKITRLSNIKINGLMTMPPLFDDSEKTRPYFRRLYELQGYLYKKYPELDWKELSMGTSSDFPAAIEEGATIIRVGTAILGPRPSRLGAN